MDAPSTSSSPTSPSTTPTSAPAHEDPSLLLFLAHSPASPALAPAPAPSPTQHPLSVANLLRPSTFTSSSTSSTSSTSSPFILPSATSPSAVDQSSSSFGFVSRVAAIPVVNSITSFYEQSKSSSPLIRVSHFSSSSSLSLSAPPRASWLSPALVAHEASCQILFFFVHFFFTFSRADVGDDGLNLFFSFFSNTPSFNGDKSWWRLK